MNRNTRKWGKQHFGGQVMTQENCVERSCRSPLRSDPFFNFFWKDYNLPLPPILSSTSGSYGKPETTWPQHFASALLRRLNMCWVLCWRLCLGCSKSCEPQSTQIDRVRIHEMMRDEGNIEGKMWKRTTSLKTWKQRSHRICNSCLAGHEQHVCKIMHTRQTHLARQVSKRQIEM